MAQSANYWEEHSIDDEELYPDYSDSSSSSDSDSISSIRDGEDGHAETRGVELYRFEAIVEGEVAQEIDNDWDPNRLFNTVW
jgi:hypothetical protein